MGFGNSAAAAILFIGVVISAGIYVPTYFDSKQQYAESLDEVEDRETNVKHTSINLSVTCGSPLELHVENNGSETLDVSRFDLLLNGRLYTESAYTTSIDGDSTQPIVMPGETLNITVTPPAENTTVKLVSEHSSEATAVCKT